MEMVKEQDSICNERVTMKMTHGREGSKPWWGTDIPHIHPLTQRGRYGEISSWDPVSNDL
jgi:hypothetical protein